MIGKTQSSGARLGGALVLSLVILVWSGCGGGTTAGSSGSTSNGMTIAPPSATLRTRESTQFSAAVTANSNQAVTWSVNGVPSRNTTVGKIEATGKNISPPILPSPTSAKIQGASLSNK